MSGSQLKRKDSLISQGRESVPSDHRESVLITDQNNLFNEDEYTLDLQQQILFKLQQNQQNNRSYPYPTFYNHSIFHQKIVQKSIPVHLYHKLNYSSKPQNLQKTVFSKIQKDTEFQEPEEKLQEILKNYLDRKSIQKYMIGLTKQANLHDDEYIKHLNFYEKQIQVSFDQKQEVYEKLSTSKIYKNQDAQQTDRIKIIMGLSEDIIYSENEHKPFYNFCFLKEADLEMIVNQQSWRNAINIHLDQFLNVFELMPLIVELNLGIDFEKKGYQELRETLKEIQITDPKINFHHCLLSLKTICSLNELNNDVEFDRNAIQFMLNIDNYYKDKFKETNIYIQTRDFEEAHIQYTDRKLITQRIINDQRSKDLKEVYLKKCDWQHLVFNFDAPFDNLYAEQQYILSHNKNIFAQSYYFQIIKDCLSDSLVDLDKKVDIQVIQKLNATQEKNDATLGSILKAETKIIFMMLRTKILEILSYINVFRSIQKSVTLILDQIKHLQFIQTDKKPRDGQIDQPIYNLNILQDIMEINVDHNPYNTILKQPMYPDINFSDKDVILTEDKFTKTENYFSLKDINGFEIIYDASVVDLKQLINEMINICLFTQEKHDNKVDMNDLMIKILQSEASFHKEKLNLSLQYLEIIKKCYDYSLTIEMAKQIQFLGQRRPSFNLLSYKDNNYSIFYTYQMEIENIKLQQQLLQDIVSFQQLEEMKFYQNQNTQNIPDPELIGAQSLINYKKDLIWQSYDHIAQFVIKIEDVILVSNELSNKDFIKNYLNQQFNQNMIIQQARQIWYSITNYETYYRELVPFQFLNNDIILDTGFNYQLLKREFMNFFPKSGKETEIDLEEYYKTFMNIIIFSDTRKQIREYVFEFSFLVELYKQQQGIFTKNINDDLRYMQLEKWLQMPISMLQKSTFSYLDYLLNFDRINPLACLNELRNWKIIVKSEEKIKDVFSYKSMLLIFKQFLMSGTFVNNAIISGAIEETKNEAEFYEKIKHKFRLKVFFQIFQYRKIIIDDTIMTEEEKAYKQNQENSIDSENSEEVFLNRGLKKVYDLNVVKNYMKKFLSLQIIKYELVINRKKLQQINRKLPFQDQIFHEQSFEEFVVEQEEDNSRNNIYFDENGNTTKIFNIPTIEFILYQDDIEIDQIFSTFKFENRFDTQLNESIKKISNKYKGKQDITNHELRKFFQIKFMDKPIDPRKFYKNRIKSFVKDFEFLDKTRLFQMNKVMTCVNDIMNYQIFIHNLEEQPNNTLHFNNSLLSKHYTNKSPSQKKYQILVKQTLLPLFQFKSKILKYLEEIKYSSSVTDVNLAICVYLSQFKTKLYNHIFYLSLSFLKNGKQLQDRNITNCSFEFIKNFAFNGFQKLFSQGLFFQHYNENNQQNYQDKIQILLSSFTQQVQPLNNSNFIIFDYLQQYRRTDVIKNNLFHVPRQQRSFMSAKDTFLNNNTARIVNQFGIYEKKNIINYEICNTKYLKKIIRVQVLEMMVNFLAQDIMPYDFEKKDIQEIDITSYEYIDTQHLNLYQSFVTALYEDSNNFLFQSLKKQNSYLQKSQKILFTDQTIEEFRNKQLFKNQDYIQKLIDNLFKDSYEIKTLQNEQFFILPYKSLQKEIQSYEIQYNQLVKNIKNIHKKQIIEQNDVFNQIQTIIQKQIDIKQQQFLLHQHIDTNINDRLQIECQKQGKNNFIKELEKIKSQFMDLQNKHQLNEKKFIEEQEMKYQKLYDKTLQKKQSLKTDFASYKQKQLNSFKKIQTGVKQEFFYKMIDHKLDVTQALYQKEDTNESFQEPYDQQQQQKQNKLTNEGIQILDEEKKELNRCFKFFMKSQQYHNIKNIVKQELFKSNLFEQQSILNNQDHMKSQVYDYQKKIEDLKNQNKVTENEIQELLHGEKQLQNDINKMVRQEKLDRKKEKLSVSRKVKYSE